MTTITASLSLSVLLVLFGNNNCCQALQVPKIQLGSRIRQQQQPKDPLPWYQYSNKRRSAALFSLADIEQQGDDATTTTDNSAPATPPRSIRARVNEVDYCMAPADASMVAILNGGRMLSPSSSVPTKTMTRYLNNASNRALRRILLSKSWPSAEALNESLRQSLGRKQEQKPNNKLPFFSALQKKQPKKKQRSNEKYIQDQLSTFRNTYGGGSDIGITSTATADTAMIGYASAEAYLECVLTLATSGIESTRVQEVLQNSAYKESYRRLVSVLERVGVEWIPYNDDDTTTGIQSRKIAPKLLQRDICLSIIDKLRSTGKNKQEPNNNQEKENETTNKGILVSGGDDGNAVMSITRQLNELSNIVQRTLLFGGDEEIKVLIETLEADQTIFQDLYSISPEESGKEQNPGWVYYQCLVQLLRQAYENGSFSTLEPPLPLNLSYANAYERLTATLIELGSGYFQPTSSTTSELSSGLPDSSNTIAEAVKSTKNLPIPRTPVEELGRFAVWETNVRGAAFKKPFSPNPDDLVGTWKVQEEVAGQALAFPPNAANANDGSDSPETAVLISFNSDGRVKVRTPSSSSDDNDESNSSYLQGLTWRLDPGPTHLDTCTFTVLAGEDEGGTVLLYRGFLDRGARLESRFSKRPLSISGKVQLQLRNDNTDEAAAAGTAAAAAAAAATAATSSSSPSGGSGGTILPINYQAVLVTNFVMTQVR